MSRASEMSNKEHASNIKPWFWLSSTGLKASSDSIISPFVPLYGVHIGANPSQIGLIVSITSLLSIVQIFWARLADKLKNSRIIAIFSNYFSSIFNFLLIIVKNLGYFISLRGIQSLIASASVPTSSAILAERTQTKDWPFWNSVSQIFILFGTLIGVLLGGFLLSKFEANAGYLIIFMLSGGVSIIGAILFHVAVPKKTDLEKKKKWHHIEEVSVSLDNILAVMKTDKNFIWLSIASFVFTFGVNFSAPFYIVYNTSNSFYSLSIFETAILSSISSIPQIIFSFLTIRFIEKLRTKEVLMLGILFTSFFPIAFLIPFWIGMIKNIYMTLIIIWLINGMIWGIITPSMMTLTLDVIHPRRRMLQIAIYNSLNSIALFIAPILGGLAIPQNIIASQGQAHQLLNSAFVNFSFLKVISSPPILIILIFIISAIFRLLGGLLFIKVQEPIIGGTILRPINKLINYPIRTNIEKTVGTLIASSSKIMHRRKTKRYGKM